MSALATLSSALVTLLLISATLDHVASTCPRTKANGTLDGLLLQRKIVTNLNEEVSLELLKDYILAT